jgi:hypothetical protein
MISNKSRYRNQAISMGISFYFTHEAFVYYITTKYCLTEVSKT